MFNIIKEMQIKATMQQSRGSLQKSHRGFLVQ